MAYKVNFQTFSILPNGKVGNVPQNSGHFFTDLQIQEIPAAINRHFECNKKVAVISKIEEVGGFVLID